MSIHDIIARKFASFLSHTKQDALAVAHYQTTNKKGVDQVVIRLARLKKAERYHQVVKIAEYDKYIGECILNGLLTRASHKDFLLEGEIRTASDAAFAQTLTVGYFILNDAKSRVKEYLLLKNDGVYRYEVIGRWVQLTPTSSFARAFQPNVQPTKR